MAWSDETSVSDVINELKGLREEVADINRLMRALLKVLEPRKTTHVESADDEALIKQIGGDDDPNIQMLRWHKKHGSFREPLSKEE